MQFFPTLAMKSAHDIRHGDLIAYGENKRGLVWQFAPPQMGFVDRGPYIVDLDDFLAHPVVDYRERNYFLCFEGRLKIRPLPLGSVEYSHEASPGDLVLIGLQEKRSTTYLALRHPSDNKICGLCFSDPDDSIHVNAHYKDYLALVKEWDLVLCGDDDEEVVLARRRYPPGLPVT